MTPEDQARLLAEWLARHPGADPPADLDPEVVEAVYALRPDLAPPPRVTADDILAELTAGPLVPGWIPEAEAEGAEEDEPTPAEVVPFPSEAERAALAPAASRPAAARVARPRRWGRWVAGTAVGTTLAMAAAALLFVRTLSYQAPEGQVAATEAEPMAVKAGPRATETERMAAKSAPREEVASIPEVQRQGPVQGVTEGGEPAVALLDTGGPARRETVAKLRTTTSDMTTAHQVAAIPEATSPPPPESEPAPMYDAVADNYEELEADGSFRQEGAGTATRSATGGASGWADGGEATGVRGAPAGTVADLEFEHKDAAAVPAEEPVTVTTVLGSAPATGRDRGVEEDEETVAAKRGGRNDRLAATPEPEPPPVEVPVDLGSVADADDYEVEEEAQAAPTSASEPVFMERSRPRIQFGRKKESSEGSRSTPKSPEPAQEVEAPPPPTATAPVAEAEPPPESVDQPTTDARLDALRARAIPSEISEEALMRWAAPPPSANEEASEFANEGDYSRAAEVLRAALDEPAPDGQISAAQAANYWLRAGDVEHAKEDVSRGLRISSANTPERVWLLILHGDALRAAGEPDRAAQIYQQAISLNLGRQNPRPPMAAPAATETP